MFQLGQTPHHQAKILIVDDQPDNLELLSTICTLHGYEVITSDRGESAIELATEVRPHVILLDINMPRMDGFTVCEMLKANNISQDIPVIFITASKEVKDKTHAFELGGNDYITKPFQVEDVVARLENQLKSYHVQTELKTKNQQLATELNQKNQRLVKETQERQSAETKLLKLNQKLLELTTLDSLTNLANRAYFEKILAKEWKRGEKEHTTLSLILCDIDCFKLYNDRVSSQAGDVCLKQVAQGIFEIANRSGDLVTRYGGDEFAVILPQTKAEDAMVIAEKIRQQIKKLSIPHPDSLVNNYITFSLGITSVIPTSDYTEEQILLTARVALDEAKKEGDRAILKLIT